MAGNIVTDRIQTDTSYASSLAIETNGAERLRIDSSGNLGLGTSSPSYKLQVYGASNPEMRLGDAVVTYQLYTEGATAAVMGTVGSHAVVLRTNATERMRIDSSGNVGIGTSSPASKLDVTATIRAVSSTPVAPTSGKGVEIWYETSGDYGRIATYDRTGAAYKNQYIDGAALYLNSQSSGNVGIGTNSPDVKLHVSNGSIRAKQTSTADAAFVFASNSSGNSINFWKQGSTSTAYGVIAAENGALFGSSGDLCIVNDASGKNIIFANNGAAVERMRIDSSGNLLVGTTSAVANTRFAVERIGGAGNEASIGFTSSGTAKWKIGNVATDAFVIYTPSNVGQYMSSGGTTWLAATSDERLKNKVSDITDALDAVSKLNPLTYYFKNEEQTGVPRYGFFAQNVGQAIPDAMLVSPTVDEELGEIYTYDSSIINVYLVKAIQEQQAFITTLTARIEALENK